MKNKKKSFTQLAENYVARTRLMTWKAVQEEPELLTELADMEERLCACFGLPPASELYGRLQIIALSELPAEEKISQLHDFLLQSAIQHFSVDAPTDRAYLRDSKACLRSPLDVLPMMGFTPTDYSNFLVSGLYYRDKLGEADLLEELRASEQKDCNVLHRRMQRQHRLTPNLLQKAGEKLRYVAEFYAARGLADSELGDFIKEGGESRFEYTIPDGTEYWRVNRVALLYVRFLRGEDGKGEVGMDAQVWAQIRSQGKPRERIMCLVAGTDTFREILRYAPDHSMADVIWMQYRQFLDDPDYTREYRTQFDLAELYGRPLLVDCQGLSLLHVPEESGLD